jgi:general transcription factor 3C protein 4
VQSLLPGCPEDLKEEGNQLSLAIQPFLTNTDDADATASIVSQLKETCPACGVEVQLQDITSAVCANGHTWRTSCLFASSSHSRGQLTDYLALSARCSVTTFILATASPRTCVGCSRKAFLSPSAKKTLPPIAQGWVVEDLLEAVQRCLFCNNGFVSIL